MLLSFYSKARVWLVDRREYFSSEGGATGVEYGLLVALIAAVIVAIVLALGENVSSGFDTVNEELENAG
ncbi:MAG: Flp family type IVb pilin [Actinomycetota bacterium]